MFHIAQNAHSGRLLRRFQILVLLLLAPVLAGCGDEEGPAQITQPKPTFDVVGGTFEVDATETTIDGCAVIRDYNGTYELLLGDSTFSMIGDSTFAGEWDDDFKVGNAESGRTVRQERLCKVTTWTQLRFNFTSEDRFQGYIIYRYRIAGDCNERKPCSNSWTIRGVRKPNPPEN